MATMILVVVVVVIALTIIVAAIGCAWRHDSLHTSDQERVDLEFERIVAALGRRSR